MDIVEVMLQQNPWWRDAGSINEDKKIVAWNGSLRYTPRIMYNIKYDFDDGRTAVYTLRGPRQVGKTTLAKLQIKKFLDNGVDPLNVLYYTMDLATGSTDVADAVKTYMRITRRAPAGRRYLFLDEISSVPDWQRGIKWLVDTEYLHNCTVLTTGSHSIDLKGAAERLPGRKGDINGAHDKILLPMKFSEYASAMNPDIRDVIDEHLLSLDDRRRVLRGLADGHVDERLEMLMLYLDVLNGLLCDYMTTGGLPRVVDGYSKRPELRDPDYGIYVDVLAGEWTRIHKDMARLKAFGQRLVASLGTPVSWTGLANKSAISTSTAQDYARTLERIFAARVVYMYDLDGRCPMYAKNKKIYFVDPFFLHMFRTMTGPDGIAESCIEYLNRPRNVGGVLEGIVADHLTRLAFLLTPKKSTFDPHHHVFYWRDSKSREVDFVMDAGGKAKMPVEVKSGGNVNAAELGGLSRFAVATGTTGVVLSRNALKNGRRHVVVPASVFLTLV